MVQLHFMLIWQIWHLIKIVIRINFHKWKEDQNNKTETETEEKEKAVVPHTAQALLNTSSEEVKTYGLYGTKKAAGVRLHDVKADY